MKKTAEINPKANEESRIWRQYNRETLLIVLICISLAFSVISWFRSERAIDDAKESIAVAATWQNMYKENERECRLAQLEINNFKIVLLKAGLDVSHEGEIP